MNDISSTTIFSKGEQAVYGNSGLKDGVYYGVISGMSLYVFVNDGIFPLCFVLICAVRGKNIPVALIVNSGLIFRIKVNS